MLKKFCFDMGIINNFHFYLIILVIATVYLFIYLLTHAQSDSNYILHS